MGPDQSKGVGEDRKEDRRGRVDFGGEARKKESNKQFSHTGEGLRVKLQSAIEENSQGGVCGCP